MGVMLQVDSSYMVGLSHAQRRITEHGQVERVPRSSHFEKGSDKLHLRSYRYMACIRSSLL